MALAFLSRFKGLNLHFTLAELEKRYRNILILSAITVIAYATVGLLYNIVSLYLLTGKSSRPVAEQAAPVSPLKREPVEYYALIPERNLFGTTGVEVAEKQQETAAEEQVENPDILRTLLIKGIVAGTGKDGFVVIEEQGKNKQLLYKVGNVVAGAKIVNIARNAVTFSLGGREIILKMTDTSEGLTTPVSAAAPVVRRSSGGSPTVVSRKEVESSLQNIGAMLSQAQIRPYYSNGAPDGFMISNIKPGSIYARVGLQNGDIIREVEGRKLTTAEDVTSFYSSLKTGSSFTLMIKRGGQDQNLDFVFR